MISVLPLYAFDDNYIWVIRKDDSPYIAVVDPGDSAPVMEFIERSGLMLKDILITHHHYDHTGGVSELVEKYGCQVYGPANEKIPAITHKLSENEVIQLANGVSFQIIDTPGHTKGHICYYGYDMLFCGDTLFSSGCGRLFEGTPAQMHASLEKIRSLPEQTLIYCAHEYTLANLGFAKIAEPDNADIQARLEQVRQLRTHNEDSVPSSLALEKRVNPFLRYDNAVLKANAEAFCKMALDNAIDVFATVRHWKDSLD